METGTWSVVFADVCRGQPCAGYRRCSGNVCVREGRMEGGRTDGREGREEGIFLDGLFVFFLLILKSL